MPVNRNYAVNGLNQYTGTVSAGAPSATFAYDDNGNLTSDGTRTYAYDAENRLVSATSGATTVTFVYDPLGRLFQTSGGSPGITQFLYDGDELVAEYGGAGNLLKRYVHGDRADDPLFWYEGTGLANVRFPHADRHGSIVAVSGSGGSIQAINNYDEYGIPGAGNTGRFQYTGQAWIPELGMYHYKARIYSPTLGRFLQTDPVGYDDQVNLYAYVGNDPVNGSDPSGMTEEDDIKKARRTLSRLRAAIQADISAASVPEAGSKMQSDSDAARVKGLKVQLSALKALKPEDLVKMKVEPNVATGLGLADAMIGARPETGFSATRSATGVKYGRLRRISRSEDSGRLRGTTDMEAIGHPHAIGTGREYPGVGDPGNVIIRRMPMVYTQEPAANAIGWNGTRFTLTNLRGATPSYSAAPAWIRDTFEPW